MFRKSCFASFANSSFARFCKYCFRVLRLFHKISKARVSQIRVSQGFAILNLARICKKFFLFRKFRKVLQLAVCWWTVALILAWVAWGATNVTAQSSMALCLTIFNQSPTHNTCIFTNKNKHSVCDYHIICDTQARPRNRTGSASQLPRAGPP